MLEDSKIIFEHHLANFAYVARLAENFPFKTTLWGADVYSQYPVNFDAPDSPLKRACAEAKVQVDKWGYTADNCGYITVEFYLFNDGNIIAKPEKRLQEEFTKISGTNYGHFKIAV